MAHSISEDDEDRSSDDESGDEWVDGDGVNLKKGKFARIVKVITHIRPLLKKHIIGDDG